MAGRNNHGSYLTDLLGHAKKGGKNLKKKEAIQTGSSLTAEQIATAHNILGMIGKNNGYQNGRNNRGTDHYHSSGIATDIHGRSNYSNDPVYYTAPGTVTARVPSVPYAVSDFNSKCKKCTKYRACDRHRDPQRIKTDISLCKGNHLRMALSWDVSDPENRKKSWKLRIEEKYDHFFNPDRERREHEASERMERDGEEDEGCQPMNPSSRIKELAKRIAEDHNHDQEDKARRAYLDPKGREYTTRPRHWGTKDPNVPAEGASTRAGYEWRSGADEGRVETELRVMLQMWYRSNMRKEERGKDRTSERAMGVWREKMKASKETQEMRFNEHGENFGEDRSVKEKKVEVVDEEQFMFTAKGERIVATSTRVKEVKAKSRKVEASKTVTCAGLVKNAGNTATMINQARKLVAYDSDDSDNGKVLGKPIPPHKIRTAVAHDGDEPPRTSSRPSKTETVSEELTTEQLAGFEQWAMAVEAEENKDYAPAEDPNNLKPQSVPKNRTSAVETTSGERELLDAMKQKAVEDIQSESKVEAEVEKQDKEEEQESSDEEVSEPPKRADAKTQAQKSVSTRMKADRSPRPPQSPAPKPSSPSPVKILTTKRKVIISPDADLPASKKNRKYKSADIVVDSDDETDYALPVAPAPVNPKQREGWTLADTSLMESVEVVQSDDRADVEVEDEIEVVVERGTTIVKEVESAEHAKSGGPNPLYIEPAVEVASSSSLSSLFDDNSEGRDIECVGTQVENEEVDGTTLVGLMMEESEASENCELVSPGLQHEEVDDVDHEDSAVANVGTADSDESILSEPPSSDDEVKDDHKPASPISQKEETDTRSTTFTEGNTSDSNETRLSEPPLSDPESDEEATLSTPASHKRKGPFDDDDEDENDVNPSKKKNKTVRFDEEVNYAFERKRRMSIPYIVEEDEGENVEDAQNVGSEVVGEVSE
ncbi:hypothetical protein IQ06DRAFT_375278 [Phaeosphaeriaceae sp. SRC1lsM3a]|nr:hypothetical protein IQ06DRAFT_375278 [Stagonospora sp. SRC1lsM3a]